MNMIKIVSRIISVLFIALFISGNVYADDDTINDNCKASKWTDTNGNGISIEEKFGPGSMDATRCLTKVKKVKIIYQINKECKNSKCLKAYAAGNIINHINDFEITHQMNHDDYEIAVIIHSAGWKLVLDNSSLTKHAANNPFQTEIENLINMPSVKLYFCQNTANSKKVIFANMLHDIGFVTAGVSAISDFQTIGYKYVQP